MTKILFVCSANIDRSPTAEKLYKNHPGLEVQSAGVAHYARVKISEEHIEWADAILCMEEWHKSVIKEWFKNIISKKLIDNLDVPDDYGYMHPQLQNIIKTRVDAWLQHNLKLSR